LTPIDSSTLPTKLRAPAGSYFSSTPAVAANLLVFAAATPYDNAKGSSSGSVFVWQRDDLSNEISTITPTKLVDPDGEDYDYLGSGSVSLSSDGLVLAAASYRDANGTKSTAGSVLVWQRSRLSENFTTPVKLRDPAGNSYYYLGYGGAVLSADGLVLAAGSYGDNSRYSYAGSVLVWQRNANSDFARVVPTKLTDPEGATYDYLGKSVLGLSADGLLLAAASPQDDDDSGSDVGSVLVWQRRHISINFATVMPYKLVDPNSDSYNKLGSSGVSISSDGLVLTAASPGDGINGSISIWRRPDTTSNFSSVSPVKLFNPASTPNNPLGSGGLSLSSNGSVLATISNGRVTLFTISGSSYAVQELEYSNPASFAVVSPSGLACLVTSTYGQDSGVTWYKQNCPLGWSGEECDVCQAGFYGPSCSPCECEYGTCSDGLTGDGTCDCFYSSGPMCATIRSTTLVDPEGEYGDDLGSTIPSLSGDGLVLAAGVPGDQVHGYSSGSVLVWQRNSLVDDFSNSSMIRLVDPDGAESDELGYGGVSLSANGLVLAAASYRDDDKGQSSGAVLVWQRPDLDANFSNAHVVKLVDPDGAEQYYLGEYGVCLSADGLVLASGANGDDHNGQDSGSILVWQRPDLLTDFSNSSLFKVFDPQGDGSYLGNSRVSLSSDALVLAAGFAEDAELDDSGSVLVWQRANVSFNFTSPVKLTARGSYYLSYSGVSMSADGLVIVATSEGDIMGSDSGFTVMWERANSSVSFANVTPLILVDPDGARGDYLGDGGATISADGLVCAVGSGYDDGRFDETGSIVVWRRPNKSVSFNSVTPVKIDRPGEKEEDYLGDNGVALSADGNVMAATVSSGFGAIAVFQG